jgi:hypothetical protein
MQHIGLMMVRNEIDIIERYMQHIDEIGIDVILVLDDSDDGTYDKLAQWDKVKYLVKQKTLYGNQRPHDGMRACLLEYAQRNYGYEGWFHILHPDEFFWDHPIKIVEEADAHGYEQVNWHSMCFFLHPDDPCRDGLPTYYAPGTIEERHFKNRPGLVYAPLQDHKVTPLGQRSLFPLTPLIRHYPLRNAQQAIARAKDRLQTGFQEQYHWVLEELHPRCHPKLKHALQFDGCSFGQYEIKAQFIQLKQIRHRMLEHDIEQLIHNQRSCVW